MKHSLIYLAIFLAGAVIFAELEKHSIFSLADHLP